MRARKTPERNLKRYVGDFETTVYEGQTFTEVWASALVEIGTEDVKIFHSIGETLDYLIELDQSVIVYYHNLKFDGSFWLDYLLIERGFKQAADITMNEDGSQTCRFIKRNIDMPDKSVKYVISIMGQWYSIFIRVNRHTIELRDSMKLLPFSVKKIGKDFETKHKKLDMEYTGVRYAGCEITPEEQDYIKNDVLVVSEALQFMFSEGHNRLTIASCCLEQFKKILDPRLYTDWFPDMYEWPLNKDIYGSETVGDYIHKAYRGGWCYVVPEKANRIIENGCTADVNSLYPSMMHSASGNYYPVAFPEFWRGDKIPEEAMEKGRYFFIRIRTRFYLKPDRLPFIQIKDSFLYRSNENLASSDILIPTDEHPEGEYMAFISDGKEMLDTRVTLTLTCTDFFRLIDFYYLEDFEILDGCYFYAIKGIFDEYIDKYRKLKETSKGAKRQLAKLFLNSLYGRMAATKDSSFKYAYIEDSGDMLGFLYQNAKEKKPGYMPIGAAITSYARDYTIRAAQRNYHGPFKKGFIYADTDSIHCDLPPSKLRGVPEDPVKFGFWKIESVWDKGIFVRQKTYIEHVTKEDGEPVKPYYNIKCAGLPSNCKDLLQHSLEGTTPEDFESLDENEKLFVSQKRRLTDFGTGLNIPGKLMPVRIPGGIVLQKTTFVLKKETKKPVDPQRYFKLKEKERG